MPDSSETPAVRDARVDRFITWALAAFAGLSFTVGAWFFSEMRNEMRGLRTEIVAVRADLAAITTRVSIVEAARLEERVRALERDVTRLEARSGAGIVPASGGGGAERAR